MTAAKSRRIAVQTETGPHPVGAYTQGIVWGDLLWISGQTPRLPDGAFDASTPFVEQVRLTLENADRIAQTVNSRLADALRITAYLVNPQRATAFDRAYADYFAKQDIALLPARTTVQSLIGVGEIEIDAVIPVQQSASQHPK